MSEDTAELQIGKLPELTPGEQDLKNLLRLSFRYSQQQTGAQEGIFKWLFKNNYFSANDVTENLRAHLFQIRPPQKHAETEESEDQKDLQWVWDALVEVAEKGQNDIENNESLLDFILAEMVAKDLLYQTEKMRPGRSPQMNPKPDSPDDGHASFVRKYLIKQEKAGHPAYDALFTQLRDRAIESQSPERAEETVSDNLLVLAQEWEQNHPGYSFWDVEEL